MPDQVLATPDHVIRKVISALENRAQFPCDIRGCQEARVEALDKGKDVCVWDG